MANQIFNANEAILKLVRDADDKGVSESCLDEIVHDICSNMASNINNGGVIEQVTFIITQMGPDGVKEIEQAFNEEG